MIALLNKAAFSISMLTFTFQLIITIFLEKSIKISKGLSKMKIILSL